MLGEGLVPGVQFSVLLCCRSLMVPGMRSVCWEKEWCLEYSSLCCCVVDLEYSSLCYCVVDL